MRKIIILVFVLIGAINICLANSFKKGAVPNLNPKYSLTFKKCSKVEIDNIASKKNIPIFQNGNNYIVVEVSLSCVTIIYSGETAENFIELAQNGYGNALITLLEWFWCQGGYPDEEELPYGYA